MQFDWWTFALQTINFVVLVILLRRFLYKPVLAVIDARRADIERQHAEAVAKAAEAKNQLAAIAAERAGIADERAASLKVAAAQAAEAAAARRIQAERELAEELDAGRKTVAAERERALAEARGLALGLATDIARRLLGEIPTDLRAEAWIQRVEQHLTDLSPAERAEIGKGLEGHGTLRIVTAIWLSDSVKERWSSRLRPMLGDDVSILFEVDAALIAGVELHFPSAILRFSWRSTLTAIEAEIGHREDAH